MQKLFVCLAGCGAGCSAPARQVPRSTVKIGMINEYSGQFADTGNQIDNGIKLYMKQHGDTVAGKKIEVIRKDTGGIAPDVAKRLAQELVVRDNADIFGGFSLTPNALAAADVSAEAKKFMVVMNAATSIITDQVALHRPHLVDDAAVELHARHLGGQERHQDGLHDGVRLRPRHRRRNLVPERLQGRRRRGRRLGPLPGRESGLLRLHPARQGHQPGRHLHLDSRRRAAGRGRQGAGRARHRRQQDQNAGPGCACRRDARCKAWATRRSASSRCPTTTTITSRR